MEFFCLVSPCQCWSDSPWLWSDAGCVHVLPKLTKIPDGSEQREVKAWPQNPPFVSGTFSLFCMLMSFPLPSPSKNKQMSYFQSPGAAIMSVIWSTWISTQLHTLDVQYLPAVKYKPQHCEAVDPDKSWIFQKNMLLLLYGVSDNYLVSKYFHFQPVMLQFSFRLFVLEEFPNFDILE